ncbi:MAG: hypothetical protein UW30_C0005G0027 [Candidatus Giovannonibacteria bacterium GW2011_GWA2_44_13b]|uniref:DUF11 domain-containing protein n=2 Tax=Candidatus Giovannoniibacteriota TaxID=1752738 RepID=A0A0G1H5F0_9BACT|nr:MAG: hypothetical protein UW30_C0005G0027 [Candidatus Giovannonibacteria bacterium GW2011_GWA2_44_13b]OGF81537.1 MAG: hypothetical protein A2924_03415 [Candidatus Giovannonibacteria bacterium RIFCSPLOWO2_01_FULL_44_16]
MADLEDLKKRLYREGEDFGERKISPELSRPREELRAAWGPDQKPKVDLKKRKIFIWLGIFTVIVSLGIFLFFQFYGFNAFLNIQDINVDITGEKNISSGDRVSWQVRVLNNNKTAIENAVLVFNYPEGATPVIGQKPEGVLREKKDLNTLNPGESASFTFNAYVFGARNSQKQVSATLEYRPKNSSATFGKQSSFSFSIAKAPVTISLVLPEDLRIGQTADLEIRYNSQSEKKLDNLSVVLSLPDGFEFVSALPAPTVDKSKSPGTAKSLIWNIGSLDPSEDGVIKIKGKVYGGNLEPKNFQASVGVLLNDNVTISVYDATLVSAVLHSPFLELTMLANGKTSYISFPGDMISFEIAWKNNLSVSVKDAILEVKLDSPPVDLKSLRIDKGSYRESSKSIVWNASSYPEFKNVAPGQSGKVKFIFKIKSSLPLETTSPRPEVKISGTLRSADSIAGLEGVDTGGATTYDIKVSSKVKFTSKGLFYNAPISNPGSLPPHVGKETTYTITWSLANMSNDVDNVVAVSSLPPYINFKNVILPANSNLTYNENSGELEWRAGRVQAGTGFLYPAMQVSFQIGLVATQDQIDSAPVLIEESKVFGKDTFTGVELSGTAPLITTDLPDDSRITSSQKKVAP